MAEVGRFLRLTPEKLILRLVNRQQHLLALRISEHLRLPTDRIYIHWACTKVLLAHTVALLRMLTLYRSGCRPTTRTASVAW